MQSYDKELKVKIHPFLILDFIFPTTPSGSPLHRGRVDYQARYHSPPQRVLPLCKGELEGVVEIRN